MQPLLHMHQRPRSLLPLLLGTRHAFQPHGALGHPSAHASQPLGCGFLAPVGCGDGNFQNEGCPHPKSAWIFIGDVRQPHRITFSVVNGKICLRRYFRRRLCVAASPVLSATRGGGACHIDTRNFAPVHGDVGAWHIGAAFRVSNCTLFF